MSGYAFHQSSPADVTRTVIATHPCQDGTSIVWLGADPARRWREPVILWGVLGDGRLVPITVNGIWSGTESSKGFIRLPCGTCTRDGESWNSEDEALRDYAGRRHLKVMRKAELA